MLTRLKVRGFKNLVDVDLRFGPFTCIAGPNGVGKSNLFDAITFLGDLAVQPLVVAAASVRDDEGRTGDVRSLFHRVGHQHADVMTFEVEMIVPASGTDDLGQEAEATVTFLTYTLELGYRREDAKAAQGSLEILYEDLSHVRLADAGKSLPFPHSAGSWRKSAVKTAHRTAKFISTDREKRLINVHQDGGSRGKPRPILASALPRTVLSSMNAAEGPTAALARQEMRSWRLLQLEPSKLRKPDDFTSPVQIGMDGSHLAATLHRLTGSEDRSPSVCARVARRLAELIDEVKSVEVDIDEKRELRTVVVTARDGTRHTARSLSDGTLRFLALTVLAEDYESGGMLCLEEPENGLHPARIPAMLALLQDIACDPKAKVGTGNPLRQVITNTHSPTVIGHVFDDDLLIAEAREHVFGGGVRTSKLGFSCLADTWRARGGELKPVAKGLLLAYLNPQRIGMSTAYHLHKRRLGGRRVADRDDIAPLLATGD